MINTLKRKYEQLRRSMPSGKQVGQMIVLVFNMLPGLLAYALEVICLSLAAFLVIQSVLRILDGQVLISFLQIILSASLLGLALMSDHYASDSTKQGGG